MTQSRFDFPFYVVARRAHPERSAAQSKDSPTKRRRGAVATQSPKNQILPDEKEIASPPKIKSGGSQRHIQKDP
jgi:hypothetical protein